MFLNFDEFPRSHNRLVTRGCWFLVRCFDDVSRNKSDRDDFIAYHGCSLIQINIDLSLYKYRRRCFYLGRFLPTFSANNQNFDLHRFFSDFENSPRERTFTTTSEGARIFFFLHELGQFSG